MYFAIYGMMGHGTKSYKSRVHGLFLSLLWGSWYEIRTLYRYWITRISSLNSCRAKFFLRGLLFPNVLCGLLTKQPCEINATDSGNISPGMSVYWNSLEPTDSDGYLDTYGGHLQKCFPMFLISKGEVSSY